MVRCFYKYSPVFQVSHGPRSAAAMTLSGPGKELDTRKTDFSRSTRASTIASSPIVCAASAYVISNDRNRPASSARDATANPK